MISEDEAMPVAVIIPIPSEWMSALIETNFNLESTASIIGAGMSPDGTHILVAFDVDENDLKHIPIEDSPILFEGNTEVN